MVVSAEKCTAGEVEATATALEQSGVTLLGTALTGIVKVYAEGVAR
jgi:hypothetical protein